MNEIVAILILVAVGLLVSVMGVIIRRGGYKRWYLVEDNSIFYHKYAFYMFIPMGLALISITGIFFLPKGSVEQSIVVHAVFSLTGLGILLSFWQPRWLKPKWVAWLEENHVDILDLLIEEARKTPNWEQCVSTQEDLEQWVSGVRHKRGLLHHSGSDVAIEDSRPLKHASSVTKKKGFQVFSQAKHSFISLLFCGLIATVLGILWWKHRR